MGLPWITVSDIKQARKLYVDILGFSIHEENPAANWLEVKCGDSIIGIWQAKPGAKDVPGQNAVLTFIVDNIEQTKATMEKQGVEFIDEIIDLPGVFKMTSFIDTDGNKCQLFQEYKPS